MIIIDEYGKYSRQGLKGKGFTHQSSGKSGKVTTTKVSKKKLQKIVDSYTPKENVHNPFAKMNLQSKTKVHKPFKDTSEILINKTQQTKSSKKKKKKKQKSNVL